MSDDLIIYADELLPPNPIIPLRLPIYKPPDTPDRFFLPPDTTAPPVPRASQDVAFWFRTRHISGRGFIIDSDWPHVLRVHIPRSKIQQIFEVVASMLPISRIIHSALPEWFLPTEIIVKIEKEGQGELFDTEVSTYHQLQSYQGTYIPRCYGSTRYHRSRCLLLEDIKGLSLSEPAGLTLSLDKLSDLLEESYRALHDMGLHQDDPQLHNFRLVNGKTIALDFERAVPKPAGDDRAENFLFGHIWQLSCHYQGLQIEQWREGNLLGEKDGLALEPTKAYPTLPAFTIPRTGG